MSSNKKLKNINQNKNEEKVSSEIETTKDKTIRVYQREKIKYHLNLAKPTWTEKQQQLIDVVRDPLTKICLLKGPAGSSKTYMSVWLALELLSIGRIQEIVCVRSLVESGSVGMGYLPGTANEKISPYAQPFLDKIKQLLPPPQIEMLLKDNRIQFLPINFMRGREFNASFIIGEETQNFSIEEIQTLLTRYGKYSKMLISGDTEQSDLETFRNRKSGFKVLYNWYDNPEAAAKGIRCFKFGIEDIRREDIIGYLVEEYQKLKSAKNNI
jgi:phosphate starvation-inducible protein PhoH and related proteins